MNKKITIAFLIPVLKGGGAERNIINLINNIDRSVYQITIVAGNVGGNFESEVPKEIIIVNLRCSDFLSLFFKLFSYVKKETPDVLVSALPHINTITMMVKFFSRVKTHIILTEHTTFSLLALTARTFTRRVGAKFILPYFMRFFYPSADAIICVSKGVMEDLSRVVGVLPQMQVIYNPVFDSNIALSSKKPLSQDQSIFNQQKPVILAVGRLVKAKDYPTLLHAFSLVLKKIPAILVILGGGPEEATLKKMVSTLAIKEHVHFLGFRKNPYSYMARSQVFVLSSIREGFGNVIVEAMACRLPVVATACKSGPGEIINNEINGLLVTPQREKELSDAIIRVLKDPLLAKKLSSGGYERATYFSIEKSVKEYEAIFNKVAHRGT